MIIPELHRTGRAVLALLAAGASVPAAALDVSQLLSACETALAAGYRGSEAAACDWYLEPCTVCAPDAPPPAWCVPDTLTGAARATLLLPALREAAASTPQRAAETVVAALLAARFPCSGAE